jgi:hypothetical protein
MSAQVAADLRAGDVVRYEPENRWCQDGYAIAEERGDRVVLVDTYWISGPSVVRAESYEVLFNLGDYEEKPRSAWETFAPADRQYIPKHSGYQTVLLVRKGATPDLSTQIENARELVSEAEDEVRSAQWGLDFARRELAQLEAAADAAEAQS